MAGEQMHAVRISGPGAYALVSRAVPEAGPGEVLLAPLAVGICRTDVELLDGTMVYLRTGQSRLPMTPGHEWVARVVAVGEGVDDLHPGQRVVGECSIGCGDCAICASGSYHQCPRRQETGVMNLDGAMADYFVFPARAAHPVPDQIATEDAVFAEPAAVALRAVLRAELRPGQRVLVVGGGTIGWLITAFALDLAEVELCVSEPDATRRQRLEALGARAAGPEESFDVVIEASGSAAGVSAGLAALAESGRYVGVGLTGREEVGIDLDRIVVSDQTVLGSLGSPGVWPQTLQLLGTGRVRPSAIITGRYRLADFPAAIETVRTGGTGLGKVLIISDDVDHDGRADHRSAS